MAISALSVAVIILFIIILIIIGSVIAYLYMYGPLQPRRKILHPGFSQIIPSILTNEECTRLMDAAKVVGFADPVLFRGFPNIAVLDATSNGTVDSLFTRISSYTGYPRRMIGNTVEIIRQQPGDGVYQQRSDGLCTNPYDISCRTRTYLGYRLMTIIIPLNTDFTGGEVYFPQQNIVGYVDEGDALIIRNSVRRDDGTCAFDPNGDYDIRPVRSGVRYFARIVIHGECTTLPQYYNYSFFYQ